MKLLEEKILKDAKILEGNVIKVDSFLNHRLETDFLDKLAMEIADYFSGKGINKILTIEASGIALAILTAIHMDNIPVVFAKKARSKNISAKVFSSKVESYTYGKFYNVMVSKEYLNSSDKLLIIDDFLATGFAMEGLIDISKQAKSDIIGLSVAIEKGFQNGGDNLRKKGFDLLSLAVVDSIENNTIIFRHL